MDEVTDQDYEGALVIVTDTANTPRIDDDRLIKVTSLSKLTIILMMMPTVIFYLLIRLLQVPAKL